MDNKDKTLFTLDELIEYAQAMVFQYKNSNNTELTAKFIEDTIKDYATWEHKDIIKLFAKKLKNEKRKNNS